MKYMSNINKLDHHILFMFKIISKYNMWGYKVGDEIIIPIISLTYTGAINKLEDMINDEIYPDGEISLFKWNKYNSMGKVYYSNPIEYNHSKLVNKSLKTSAKRTK